MPEVGRPVTGAIGYHIRPGGHALTLQDWELVLDFARRRLC
jgi:hypothetical protein